MTADVEKWRKYLYLLEFSPCRNTQESHIWCTYRICYTVLRTRPMRGFFMRNFVFFHAVLVVYRTGGSPRYIYSGRVTVLMQCQKRSSRLKQKRHNRLKNKIWERESEREREVPREPGALQWSTCGWWCRPIAPPATTIKDSSSPTRITRS